MRFGSPLDLLWLAPLLGGIVALYLLKKKRREVTVPSLFLWDKILQSVQADTPFQRLRPTLLLFLQLLTAFLLIFALAQPYLLGSGLAGHTYAIVIDDGARMNSTDIAPSRLSEAKREAQNLVSHMARRDQAMVIAAGAQPNLLCPLTSDRSRLSHAIEAVPPTDEESDLPAALTLARGLLAHAGRAQAVVFSDGANGANTSQIAQAAGNLPLRFVTVASPDPANVGIVAMDSRRDPDNPAKGYQVFVGIKNFGPSPVSGGQLTLAYAGHAVAVRPLHMAANGGEQTETFQSTAFSAGGVVTASLSGIPRDSLATDNSASVVIAPARARKALLVTTGDVFLEKGLSLDPDLALYEVAPQDFATIGHNGQGYDLVIFDDFLPPTLPPGRYLVFHAIDPQMPVQAAGADIPAPAVLDWNRTDPIMRFVDLSGLTVQTAAKVSPASWGAALAEGENGPLIVSGTNGATRVVWLAFSPPDSNFGLQVSFPIFLTNAVEWLTQNPASGEGSLTPGQPIALPHGGDWTITRPGGATATLHCGDTDTACAYPGDDRVGLYKASAGTQNLVYAVDLDNESQSNLVPVARSNESASGPSQVAQTAPADLDIWPWVAAGALAILTLEWLAYHRRL